jgi:outer membrane immunogenic protein
MRRSAAMWVPVAFVAFLSVCSTASAADLRGPVYKAPPLLTPVPVFSWTGVYVGGHVGYGWSHFSGSDPTGVASADADGWLGGLTMGFNYQINSFVIGVEGDYSWADVKKTTSDPLGLGGGEATLKNDYFATAAVRLGYAVDRLLIYGKGGAAWTRDKYDITDGVGGFANGSFNRTGWMLGAGLEYAFWNNLSAKIEYNYLSFKSIDENLTTGGGLTTTPASVKLDAHLVKLGVNYRFNIWN